MTETGVALILLSLLAASLWVSVRTFCKISRFNREVYPKLQSEWTHTYMCQRCGNPVDRCIVLDTSLRG